jgi:O-antigen/teichoic acid export membrane protein
VHTWEHQAIRAKTDSPASEAQTTPQTVDIPNEVPDKIDWLPTLLLPALSAEIGRDISDMATTQVVAVRSTEVSASATRRLASSSLIQGVGKLLTYVMAIAVMGLITRQLSIDGYGDYIIVITVFSLVQLIAQAGTTRIGVREAAKYPDDADSIVSAAITLRIVTSVIIYGLTALGAQFLPYSHEVKLAMIVIAVSFIFYSTAMGLDVVFLPRINMVAAVVADFVNETFMVVALVALLIVLRTYHMEPSQVFYIVVAITALANVLTFAVRWIGARRLTKFRLHIEPRHWRYLLSLSIPMAVVGVMEQIQYRADAFIISLMRPEHDIAVYGLAVKTMDVVLTVPVVLIGTVFPVLARYALQDNARFQRAIQRVFNGSVVLAAPIVLMLILLAPGIVFILGSGKLPESALPLQILSFSALFNFIATLYSNLIIIYNRQSSLVWTYVMNIAINVGLNILLIPHYSYLGSAVITVLTECLRLITVIIVAARVFKFAPSLVIIPKTIIACVAMGASVLGLEATHLLQSPIILLGAGSIIGCISYGIVLLLVGGVDDALVKIALNRVPALSRRVRYGRASKSR